MSNKIALAWRNLFDDAVITASSAAPMTPASTLQQEDVARKWRGISGATESITATWDTDQTADTFSLMGVGDKVVSTGAFLQTGTVRLQLTSAGGATGDIYGPAAVAGVVDPKYGYSVHLLSSKTFRSATWTLAQAGADYIEAGRGFVGVLTEIDGVAMGAARTVVDPSTKKKTDGNLMKIRRLPGYRTQEFELGWLTEALRWSLVEEIDYAVGAHGDLLIVYDLASPNLGRDTIWGPLDKVERVIRPGGYGLDGKMQSSRAFMQEERG
jgi:hypothetical protein